MEQGALRPGWLPETIRRPEASGQKLVVLALGSTTDAVQRFLADRSCGLIPSCRWPFAPSQLLTKIGGMLFGTVQPQDSYLKGPT